MGEIVDMFPGDNPVVKAAHERIMEIIMPGIDVDRGLEAIIGKSQKQQLPFPDGVPYTLDHTNSGLAPIFLGKGEQIRGLNTLAKLGSFALPEPPITT